MQAPAPQNLTGAVHRKSEPAPFLLRPADSVRFLPPASRRSLLRNLGATLRRERSRAGLAADQAGCSADDGKLFRRQIFGSCLATFLASEPAKRHSMRILDRHDCSLT